MNSLIWFDSCFAFLLGEGFFARAGVRVLVWFFICLFCYFFVIVGFFVFFFYFKDRVSLCSLACPVLELAL